MALAAPASTGTIATPRPRVQARLESIDLLRGLVMVVMVLDHIRDYVYAGSFGLDPTDLTKTTTALFLTRWVTHFCAPVFVFLAGLGAYLQAMRGKSAHDLSRFLLTRGLWLIVLEFTVVRTGIVFNVDYSFLGGAQVIWAIGVSMLVLAGLVHFPVQAIAAFGIAVIALHNLLDGIHLQGWQGPGTAAPRAWMKLWFILHQPNELFPLFGATGPVVLVLYPLLPWIGVMAAGYAAGTIYELDPDRRRTRLRAWGVALIVAFVALRAANVYGDPHPWALQRTPVFTLLSFLNATKYPVSLVFLLMTIGPAFLALAWLETYRGGRLGRALICLGRVPLFFYLLQWPVAHMIALAVSYGAGQPVGRFFLNPPALLSDHPGTGFGLPMVYLCWALVILLLFPLCIWFAGVKQRRRDPWLSYL
jgi:uncharacterized membrane protein